MVLGFVTILVTFSLPPVANFSSITLCLRWELVYQIFCAPTPPALSLPDVPLPWLSLLHILAPLPDVDCCFLLLSVSYFVEDRR